MPFQHLLALAKEAAPSISPSGSPELLPIKSDFKLSLFYCLNALRLHCNKIVHVKMIYSQQTSW